ncbi:MAG: homoserine dehydrogenase, partial [Planctomycetes bacterium]|nr:homoserine dehydrogenase [Planctomycetota bacterium]
MTDNVIKVGLVGFGTVGTGVAKILLEDADAIQARTGLRIELATVVDLDTTSPRPVKLPEGMLTDDLDSLLGDESIQVAVELVGGTTFAKDLQLKMLQSGKHVVTANKALLAKFGTVLYAAAIDANRCIGFEASCAGGIPIVLA